MFQMLGVFAEFERSIIAERVRAGLVRVRAEGKRLGGPAPIAADLEKAIRAALDKPERTDGVRKIAARFGIDPGTVQKISVNRPFVGGSVAA
jgi:DNA invertase Pin-like site-specific DNA recombinase